MNETITVLGGGAWGTAVATLLANNGRNVVLWCYEPEVAQDIQNSHKNTRFLPGVQLNPAIVATSDLREAVRASQWLFEAVPVKNIRTVFEQIRNEITSDHKIVILSKGIEQGTLLLPTEIIAEVLGSRIKKNLAVLGGPNFAHELAEKVPTATMVASLDTCFANDVVQLLDNDYFKSYVSTDVIGVQAGGAFKNVIALAMGIAHGAAYKNNTNAYLLCQGLSEIGKLTVALGGQQETVYGLAGLGDVYLCVFDSLSRNFKTGKALGQGYQLSDIKEQYSVLPEGFNTLQTVKALAKKHSLDLPLCRMTYDFVFEGKCFKRILYHLMGVEGC